MSKESKYFLSFLAIGVAVFVWYSRFWIQSNPSISTSPQISCVDADSDGLCENNESRWSTNPNKADTDGDGFEDGGEVLAGHNPTKAGPDDFLAPKENLTQHVGALVLARINTGDLQKENPQSEDAFVAEISRQYIANEASPMDLIRLASSSYDVLVEYSVNTSLFLGPLFEQITERHRIFLDSIAHIPLSDLPQLHTKDPREFQRFSTNTDTEIAVFEQLIHNATTLAAPPRMVPLQRALLLYLRKFQQRYVALKNITQDPLMGLISLQMLNSGSTDPSLELSVSMKNQILNVIR